MIEDVTKRKDAENALRENQQRLAAMQANTPIGLTELALDGRWVSVNDEFCRIVGYTRDELLKLKFFEITFAEDLPRNRELFRQLTAGEISSFRMDKRFVRKDGSLVWVDVNRGLVKDDAGKPLYVVGAIVDISDKKLAEERQRASERQLLALFESAPDGNVVVDGQGMMHAVNAQTERLFGYRREELVGRPVEVLIPDWFAARHVGHRTDYLSQPGIRPMGAGLQLLGKRKDGSEFPVDVLLSPVEIESGRVLAAVRDITQRKQAEAALRESEERLRLAQESANVGIWDWHVATGRLDWTPKLERIYGYEPGTFPGNYAAFCDRVHPDDLAEMERLRDDAVQAQQPFDVDFRVRLPSGEIRWVNARGSATYDADGKPQRVLGVNVDITERKEVEEALCRSNARNELILAGTGAATWDWNVPEKRVLFSPRWKQLRGLSEAEVGDSEAEWSERIHPVDKDRVMKAAAAHFAGQTPLFDEEYRVRHKSDRWVWILDRGVITARDAAGNVVQMMGCETDITERKQLEQAVYESEVRYRRLFQTAKDGILLLNTDTGKITDANAFMSALTGVEVSDLIGKELYQIGMFGDESENRAAFRELRDKHYIRYDHLPIQNQRGEKVEVEVIANVYHEDHTLVAQCNVRDISERMKLMNQIAQQSEAIADESRRKDEFLAMLSHELRNPLAPIRSAVHLLRTQERAGGENSIQKMAHEIIERQVASLTKLVSDLLELSRVVSGRIRLDQQIVDLNQVAQHAIESVIPLFEKRKHELALNLNPDPVWVNADATRLEQVFVNLLNNAAKYTPDGGKIEVWCEHPHGTNYAQFRIRDNGVGIDEQLLPRIFDLFAQADRSLARSAGGLGIGLSLAHRLIDMHGGTIEATSDGPGTGAEFTVKLALMAASPSEARAESRAESVKPDRAGVRVLVVDDNIDLVMTLASSLRQKGYSVQSAYTGSDGLKVTQQWRPDIVLLDIGLPGLDGYEVARQIRADKSRGLKKIRLIALTGYGRDADISLAREAGFDAHLVKPFEFHELVKLMVTKK